MKPILHLIANAHLDPVWLWDWREGMTEGIQTCKTVLDLMDENPALTFTRGESAIYAYVEKYAPEVMARLHRAVERGVWEVAGGTYVQCDNLMPDTECLLRQYAVGQRYFKKTFGRPVTVGWAADSFGHGAGLPRILAAAGIDSYSFMRGIPQEDPEERAEAFWWEGSEGQRILVVKARPYCSNRGGLVEQLEDALQRAGNGPLANVAVFYGLGNHGGNPTRAMQTEIVRWSAEHPGAEVVYSGLARYFTAVRRELAETEAELPVFRGEAASPKPRGGASTMMRFKYVFRQAQARLLRAERLAAAVGAALDRPGVRLDDAWNDLLFNSFHDILPGTSIERAMQEQLSWLGGIDLAAQRAEADHLLALAGAVDTTVPAATGDRAGGVPFLVFNPHPYPYRGHLELETCMDYRPVPPGSTVRVYAAARRELPQQEIKTEENYGAYFRKRLLVPVELPPLGWTVLEYACDVDGGAPLSRSSTLTADAGVIANEFYRLEVRPGSDGVAIQHRGRPLFGGETLGVGTFTDDWGAWGRIAADSTDSVLAERWRVTQSRLLESGPERVALWAQFAGGRSRIDFTFSLTRDREAVDVAVRFFWDERRLRLKLIVPGATGGLFETPGGTIARDVSCGVVPGCRLVRLDGPAGLLGFASDGLTEFDLDGGHFHATLVRSSGYTQWHHGPDWSEPWLPVSDSGEYRFKFLLQPGDDALSRLADELEQPPLTLPVPAAPGTLPRQGSLLNVEPFPVRLLALKPAWDGDGLIFRLQSEETVCPRLTWQGRRFELAELPAGAILTYRLARRAGAWTVLAADLTES